MGALKALRLILVIAVIFIAGWLSNNITATDTVQQPSGNYNQGAAELPGPYDHIKEEQIKVYPDRILIDLKNANWARFTNTNSMDPVLDDTANSIEIVPKSENDVHIGDIIAYKSEFAEGITIHRVINIGSDESGWYAVLKGDNLAEADPGRIRFSQITGILVGILY